MGSEGCCFVLYIHQMGMVVGGHYPVGLYHSDSAGNPFDPQVGNGEKTAIVLGVPASRFDRAGTGGLGRAS